MDDFGMFARDLGFRPQGKSAPMKSSGIGSDRSPATSSTPFSDDQFGDVFGGPPKYSSSSNNKTSSVSDFDYDSIFKSSVSIESKNKSNSASTEPVYDKPVYDEDIFDGLPGLKSKSMSAAANYDENVFASMSSTQKQSSGDQFDDLLGNLGKREKSEPNNKSSRDFDDLIPGFGSGTPSNRYYYTYIASI